MYSKWTKTDSIFCTQHISKEMKIWYWDLAGFITRHWNHFLETIYLFTKNLKTYLWIYSCPDPVCFHKPYFPELPFWSPNAPEQSVLYKQFRTARTHKGTNEWLSRDFLFLNVATEYLLTMLYIGMADSLSKKDTRFINCTWTLLLYLHFVKHQRGLL